MNEKTANVQRTASYRAAVRRSAPPVPINEINEEPIDTEDIQLNAKSSENELIITSQPTKNTTSDDNVKYDQIVMLENGNNDYNDSDECLKDKNYSHSDNECSKFCCEKCCCNYCHCCPKICFDYMKSLQSSLNNLSDCGLNLIRVFTQ